MTQLSITGLSHSFEIFFCLIFQRRVQKLMKRSFAKTTTKDMKVDW